MEPFSKESSKNHEDVGEFHNLSSRENELESPEYPEGDTEDVSEDENTKGVLNKLAEEGNMPYMNDLVPSKFADMLKKGLEAKGITKPWIIFKD